MSNDTSTLNGSLLEMKDQLIYQLGQKGVNASYDPSTGLLGLISKIGDIQTGGGGSGVPCYKVEFTSNSWDYTDWDFTTSSHFAHLEVYLQYQYEPYSGTVTLTDGTNTWTATTGANGLATFNIPNVTAASTTYTVSYTNTTDTLTVKKSTFLHIDKCDSATGLTGYGSSMALYIGSNSAGTPSCQLTYDSTDNAYDLHSTNTSTTYYSMIPITSTSGKTNYVVDALFKGKSKSNNEVGIFVADGSNQANYGIGVLMYVYGNKYYVRRLNLTATSTSKNETLPSGTLNGTDYFRLHMEVDDTGVYTAMFDDEDNLIYEYSYAQTISNKLLGLVQRGGSAANTANRVKHIKVRSTATS